MPSSASLELFPERPAGAVRSLQAAEDFAPGRPSFVSVTSSSMDYTKTLALCSRLLFLGHSPAAHMLSAGRERKEIETIIDATIVAGVRNVLALRGDKKVSGEIKDPVNDSAELVRMLCERDAFDEVIVAGYPDIHPDSPNSVADLQQMVRKVAAGATRIITQFCFEVDTLCKYRDKLADVGVTKPISVGLLPIRNFEKMIKFAERCKAHVPSDLQERFSSADPKEHPAMAQELLNQMTKELVVKGFDIHYYTLNSVSMVNEAWRAALAGQRQEVS